MPTYNGEAPHYADNSLITPWVFFCYMVVGMYAGFACIGVFVYWYWYLYYYEGNHTNISWKQLSTRGHCSEWMDFKVNDSDGQNMQNDPYKYFTEGKQTPFKLLLSVLASIEMFNALNALS